MITSTGLAILALFVTSLVVRVLPAFLGIRISGAIGLLLERVLPTAVFLNFAVYIIFSEVKTAPLPAILAIAAVGVMTFLTPGGPDPDCMHRFAYLRADGHGGFPMTCCYSNYLT